VLKAGIRNVPIGIGSRVIVEVQGAAACVPETAKRPSPLSIGPSNHACVSCSSASPADRIPRTRSSVAGLGEHDGHAGTGVVGDAVSVGVGDRSATGVKMALSVVTLNRSVSARAPPAT
jgi:hypothetical protein